MLVPDGDDDDYDDDDDYSRVCGGNSRCPFLPDVQFAPPL